MMLAKLIIGIIVFLSFFLVESVSFGLFETCNAHFVNDK